MVRWLWAAVIGLLCVAHAPLALAAPARLNDEIPDAVPDDEGIWSFGYGYQNIALEGPLTSSSSTHSLMKLRYQVTPDANVAMHYGTHSLAGGVGLLNPLFDNQDEATSLGFDLRLNLLNEASRYDPAQTIDGEPVFFAGSAFDIGVGLERLNLSGAVDADDTLLRAYLAYSTDLSEQLRAHTFFSTGRISGDTHTGSHNRVGAGLDYALSGGRHPLTLMADAVLDVYNFRAPTFNTSRITSFDVGLRYGFNPNLYGSLGWMTYNDSENDASGSGLFAGLQWLSDGDSSEYCEPANQAVEGFEVPAPTPAAPGEAAPDGTTTIDPAAPVAAPAATPGPEVVQQPIPAEAAAPVEAPPVVPGPEPAPAAEPAPASAEVPVPSAEENLILPDGRADVPARVRVVSSLQNEFADPAPEAETQLADSEYDPYSWEEPLEQESASDSAVTETSADDDGVTVPQLDLFPESVQASAGDVRPRTSGVPRGGKSSASAPKEKSYPSTDQAVVEVEITDEPPVEDVP